MADTKTNLQVLLSPDGLQQYVLGYKKDGHPRAVYDIVRDCMRVDKKKKKGKKHKASGCNSYAFYLDTKGKKKKKKKKKNKNRKHWHISDSINF